jgi:alpha-L-rhamnosidase
MVYDANKEIVNWNTTAYDDKNWKAVNVENYPKKNIVQNLGESVKRIQELAVVKEIVTPKKEKVFDFGQNLTGRVRFNLKGKKGDTITILHAEVLDKAGNFYTENLRGAMQRVQYIFKDDKPVVFEPEFTYQGFRYIKIEGFKGEVHANNFTAIVIHSDMEPTGEFVCSDSLINKLHSNIRWGMRGNFLEVPTDCPQRNERLGWTGDVQVFSSTANYLFNTGSFYRKWLEDLKADQLNNGSVPNVVPAVFKEYGCAGWGDVATVLPFNAYLSYGDKQIIEQQYNSMKAWVDFLKKQSDSDFILRKNSKYGDWLFFIHPTDWSAKPGYTDNDLIGTAYFAHSSQLLAQAAEVIGKKEDAQKYQQLFSDIKTAFQREYMTPTGRLSSNSQTAYAMALMFDLLPENLKANAVKYLTDDIKSRKYHLSTGFLGTPLLCHVLSENGANNVAYQLLLQKTYPSWLYPVTKGATTIWERWDGIKPDGTFQTTKMNSFNHYAYGAIGSWMYAKVAGIGCDKNNVGYKHIILKPMPDTLLHWANAKYITPYGLLQSQWRINGNVFNLKVTIPSNTTATVYLPYSKEVKEVGSGIYNWEYPIAIKP